tara:strand:+ start:479 stop:1024 length:546 start_codon:yes stop_codon:yes gene_type:complete
MWETMKVIKASDRHHWKLGRSLAWRDLVEWHGITKVEAKKMIKTLNDQVFYANDLYNCQVTEKKYNQSIGTEITELSITRRDRKAIHDWRHLQWIKNDILGVDVEAIELYPSESRLLDTANTFWLYAFPKGEILPFGRVFDAPMVMSTKQAWESGAVQREYIPYELITDTEAIKQYLSEVS